MFEAFLNDMYKIKGWWLKFSKNFGLEVPNN